MLRLSDKWKQGKLRRAVNVLSKSDQKKVLAVIAIQICLGLFDLLGVMAVGVLGALSVSGFGNHQPGSRVSSVLRVLHINGYAFQKQAMILGLLAVFLFVGRTILSIVFIRRIMFFLARRGASISSNLIGRLLAQPLLVIQSRSIQETLFAVTRGVEYVTLFILATGVVLVSDISLLLVMAIGLLVVDPTIAVSTVCIFGLLGFALYRLMHVRAEALGIRNSELNIASNEKIVEVFGSYRESVVRNRRDYYAREIGKLRFNLANTSAEFGFMPYIGKYVIETSVILGALLIAAGQFLLQDATHAVATLAIFLAAGTRIAPAVLRVQQGSITIKGSLGMALPTLELFEQLSVSEHQENFDDEVDVIHEGFSARICLKDVNFKYLGSQDFAITNLTLDIPEGQSIAIVGPSGAGKTTLVDLILGVLTPDEGLIEISGLPPLETISKWSGAISYVPQDVMIINGSIRENIALGFPIAAATNELVESALRSASLGDFVAGLPLGMDTPVGERGTKISGGQRQRLGIARALFTKPKLLVLDEATSSLDGKTESEITHSINSLRGATTVIMIAHRLSTVRAADLVVYMEGGKILYSGRFDEVRSKVPDFDKQAKLMGL